MNVSLKLFSYSLFCVLSFTLAFPCYALDPEPRKWNHVPMDVNFAGAAYVYTDADIFVDPVLKLENVNMKMKTLGGVYIRTFELFGKSARIDLTQGYKEATWTGTGIRSSSLVLLPILYYQHKPFWFEVFRFGCRSLTDFLPLLPLVF